MPRHPCDPLVDRYSQGAVSNDGPANRTPQTPKPGPTPRSRVTVLRGSSQILALSRPPRRPSPCLVGSFCTQCPTTDAMRPPRLTPFPATYRKLPLWNVNPPRDPHHERNPDIDRHRTRWSDKQRQVGHTGQREDDASWDQDILEDRAGNSLAQPKALGFSTRHAPVTTPMLGAK